VSSTGFFFQLEFKRSGPESKPMWCRQVLTRNVAGYSVTNPRDDALRRPACKRKLPFEQIY